MMKKFAKVALAGVVALSLTGCAPSIKTPITVDHASRADGVVKVSYTFSGMPERVIKEKPDFSAQGNKPATVCSRWGYSSSAPMDETHGQSCFNGGAGVGLVCTYSKLYQCVGNAN